MSANSEQYVPLVKREDLSHDVTCFTFKLTKPDMPFGLPVGKHIKVYGPNKTGIEDGKWNGRDDREAGKTRIERKYSPTTDSVGTFDLVIKRYDAGVEDRFPDGGKMSTYIHAMKIGDNLCIGGPYGHIEYAGPGLLKVGSTRSISVSKIGMIAGGVGLTPLLRIINSIFLNPKDSTEVWLLFANKTEDDIFLRSELEKVQGKFPERFHLHYTLDNPPSEWKYSSGFIDEQMVRDHLPPPAPDACVCICGPPPMVKFACKPNLEKCGHDKSQVVVF